MSEILRYSLQNKSYLPVDYTPISYLESSGSLWIDTGVIPNSNTKIYIDCIPNSGSAYGCLIGTETTANDYIWRLPIETSATSMPCYIGTTYRAGIPLGLKTLIYMDCSKLVYNGTTVTYSTTVSATYSLGLFALMRGGSLCDPGAKIKMYACRIWDGNSLLRDFRPCYYQPTSSSTPVYGMFDVVQLKFYSSASSTAFTGSVELCQSLPNDYQQVEYLLFNAGKYYTTDIVVAASDTLTVTTGISYKSGESGRDLMGYSGSSEGYWGVTAAGAWEAHGTNFSYSLSDITKYTTIVYTKDDSYSGTWLLGALVNKYTTRTKYISSVKIVKNSSTVADYIACYRRSDGQLGFYDLATSSFKAVGSTIGEFPLGPSLPWLAGIGNDVGSFPNLLEGIKASDGKLCDVNHSAATPSSSYTDICTWNSILKVTKGTTVTVSFDAYSQVAQSITCYFYNNNSGLVLCSSGKSSTGATTTGSDGGISIALTTSWTRYWVTWNMSTDTSKEDCLKNLIVGRVLGSSTNAGKYVYIRNVKLHWGAAGNELFTDAPAIPYNLHSSPLHPQGVYHNLPSGYLEVGNITNTANAYIDTGLTTTSGHTIKYETEMIGVSGTYMGALSGGYFGVGSYWNFGGNNSSATNDGKSYYKVTMQFVVQDAALTFATTVNGTSYSVSRSTAVASGLKIGIFALPDSPSSYYVRGSVKYFNVYDNGSLVRLMIPAIRTSDSVVGMYDLVTMSFYAPSGTLSPGPAVGRLEGSLEWNNSKLRTTIPNLTTYTMNIWMYRDDWNTTSWETLFNFNGKEFNTKPGGSNTASIVPYNWDSSARITYPTNLWTMITLTCDGTNSYVYVDGELKSTLSGKAFNTGTSLMIGWWADSNTEALKAKLHDFRLYDDCKNATFIQSLYLAK